MNVMVFLAILLLASASIFVITFVCRSDKADGVKTRTLEVQTQEPLGEREYITEDVSFDASAIIEELVSNSTWDEAEFVKEEFETDEGEQRAGWIVLRSERAIGWFRGVTETVSYYREIANEMESESRLRTDQWIDSVGNRLEQDPGWATG